MKRLENKNHQWITGAVKSTPIPAMQLIVHQSPIEYELEKDDIIQYEKLIILPFSNWELRNFMVSFKSKEKFLSKVHEMKLRKR